MRDPRHRASDRAGSGGGGGEVGMRGEDNPNGNNLLNFHLIVLLTSPRSCRVSTMFVMWRKWSGCKLRAEDVTLHRQAVSPVSMWCLPPSLITNFTADLLWTCPPPAPSIILHPLCFLHNICEVPPRDVGAPWFSFKSLKLPPEGKSIVWGLRLWASRVD